MSSSTANFLTAISHLNRNLTNPSNFSFTLLNPSFTLLPLYFHLAHQYLELNSPYSFLFSFPIALKCLHNCKFIQVKRNDRHTKGIQSPDVTSPSSFGFFATKYSSAICNPFSGQSACKCMQ